METVSSVTPQSVISLSLVSKQYARLVQQQGHPTDCRVSDELDELLMAALQQYEQLSQTRPIALRKNWMSSSKSTCCLPDGFTTIELSRGSMTSS